MEVAPKHVKGKVNRQVIKMVRLLRNIALISLLMVQLVLFFESKSIFASDTAGNSGKQSELFSIPDDEGSLQLVFLQSDNEREKNPLLSSKIETRIEEVNHYRTIYQGFAFVERVTYSINCIAIRCNAERHSFPDSDIDWGYLSFYQQFRI